MRTIPNDLLDAARVNRASELRVANTPINLLQAVPRPSGLAGPPRLVPYRTVTLAVPGQ
jgi:hypothetical protein